ncbi:hypothetical protein Hte_009296 [Hypoxylon texense]
MATSMESEDINMGDADADDSDIEMTDAPLDNIAPLNTAMSMLTRQQPEMNWEYTSPIPDKNRINFDRSPLANQSMVSYKTSPLTLDNQNVPNFSTPAITNRTATDLDISYSSYQSIMDFNRPPLTAQSTASLITHSSSNIATSSNLNTPLYLSKIMMNFDTPPVTSTPPMDSPMDFDTPPPTDKQTATDFDTPVG